MEMTAYERRHYTLVYKTFTGIAYLTLKAESWKTVRPRVESRENNKMSNRKKNNGRKNPMTAPNKTEGRCEKRYDQR